MRMRLETFRLTEQEELGGAVDTTGGAYSVRFSHGLARGWGAELALDEIDRPLRVVAPLGSCFSARNRA